MKKALVLVAILLLPGSLAWAEEARGATAAPEFMSPADAGSTKGSCILPDFTGLSPEQRLSAALAAGFQTAVSKSSPLCPTVFHCSSIANCVKSTQCFAQSLGPCCDLGDGIDACCARGNIIVRECLCNCTTSPCRLDCIDNSEITVSCS